MSRSWLWPVEMVDRDELRKRYPQMSQRSLSDEILSMTHGFSDQGRKDVVRDLAARVAELEAERDRLQADVIDVHERANRLERENQRLERLMKPNGA